MTLMLTGCQSESLPRVVRLALNPGLSTWRLAVNGHSCSRALSGSDLTNTLTKLELRQGDVLLVDSPPDRGSGYAQSTKGWVSDYCQSHSVAVYLAHALGEIDMFSVCAYHWNAPYRNPFDLTSAGFFCEGRLLGKGEDGFAAMLRQIDRKRPRRIFILGSMYDFNRGFPPDPNPYEGMQDRLASTLKATGTDLISLSALPGF